MSEQRPPRRNTSSDPFICFDPPPTYFEAGIHEVDFPLYKDPPPRPVDPVYCECDLRDRQWNPNTHTCETCRRVYKDSRST